MNAKPGGSFVMTDERDETQKIDMSESSLRRRRENRAGASTTSIKVTSILEVVQGLKEQIAEKEQLLKAKSQALIDERNFIENVIESVGDSLIVVGPDSMIQSVNSATEVLLGYRREQLVGKPFVKLLAREEDRQRFSGEAFCERIKRIQTDFFEMQWLTRNAEEISISWRGSVLRDAENQVRGYVGIARDLSEERRIQEAKLKAVQVMAASVAHEIRNPLGAIQNAIALLIRDLDLAGEDKELMEIVREETLRIKGIVSQFLNFARPSRSSMKAGDISILLFDLARIAECDERMGSGHKFVTEIADGLPEVCFDPDQMKQVLWNLISNGFDAMDEPGQLSLRAFCEDRELVIEVEDSGSGIPADQLAKIYEPFVTTKSRGTGLGLPIARRIIEQHRSVLQVDTRFGVGTCFTIRMPVRFESE